ncbi:aminotransferase class V-fold PLP-dependent enzyme [Thalassotalea castellviae]|uniref:Aminotransferase class V-fold PLP-dependent enzyme n=1 Tax=Thalassotalea castellviae TaxID=3075612 RepID=A0ABU3A221_9GAMM|nr:aminotransferase class V-fold PLP-dependent enzyme [Thalassotalea sp. W431]MDT0602986.1 aminotransferase class V-fold PLP-dependent enzyme [Thalassotalea sp. W431]
MSNLSPWKKDFSIFVPQAQPYLCYLDTAATCLTPKHVAEAMFHYQCYSHANSHQEKDQINSSEIDKLEQAREKVACFIGAQQRQSIVFNTGATDGVNQVAYGYVEPIIVAALKKGQHCNIVISAAEHHSNILAWQRLVKAYQVELRIAPLAIDGLIDIARLALLLDENTCILAFSHCSNVIGKMNPVEKICQLAKSKGIATLIDGAQAVLRSHCTVATIDCDFYVFSAHKIYGPTGCGVLYVKPDILREMLPSQWGAGMAKNVNYKESEFFSGPSRFESSTPNMASIVGLVEAIDYLNDLSLKEINLYLDDLAMYMHKSLSELAFYRPVVDKKITLRQAKMSTLVSFQCQNIHCQDVASLLRSENIALSCGNHAAQPLHSALAIEETLRVSLGIYNGYADIDKLIASLSHCHQMMALEDFV